MEYLYTYQQLYTFASSVFLKMGCNEADATTATHTLLSADLRGVDSHGIARLIGYVRLWEKKRVNASPHFSILHQTPSTAVLDADQALGLVSAPYAMQVAIEKAAAVGTGWVSVQNSNHFGIAGYHALMAVEKDMIGIAMTNASALVAPTYANERLLGTNPIAVAIPAGNYPPFVADFATTTASNGKLEILQRLQEDSPSGWLQDEKGKPTQNASALKEGGALLPLGGDKVHGSHKGYMLGSIVDIFSAILSGANYGPWVPPFPAYIAMPQNMPGKGIGHFLGAMRIDAFRAANEFKKDMDQWIKRFKEAKTTTGHKEVIIPGEPERLMEAQRSRAGIPLLKAVVDDLTQLAEKFSLEIPAPI